MNIKEEAKKLGIVDIDSHPGEISKETVELVVKLTKKHAPEVYKKLEERRNAQKNS